MGLLFRITVPLLLSTVLLHVSDAYRIVCVYTNWAQYRPDGGKFLPEDIDAQLCTHIIYVYAKLKGNKLEAMEWNDEDSRWSEGMYTRVNNLKKTNPELKTLLGVGGWMMGSKDFSRLAASRGSRRVFAQTTVKFLRDRGFDGLTIDWQHPTMRGGKPRDKENFSELLKELRNAFDMDGKTSGLPTLLLTAGVSASKQVMENAYEIDNITRFTDFLNVMAYDLHGSWDNFTGHPSQLYQRKDELGPSSEINVDTIMKMWIAKSGDRSKLNLGISTYGRTFTLKHPNHNGYEVPSTGPGTPGEFTQQAGMLAHYERCNRYFDATHVWDDTSKASYWFQGDQWIAGEDTESVKAKITWAKYHKIGGAMIWSLDTDDFSGSCQLTAYPITALVHSEFEAKLNALQLTQMKQREESARAIAATTVTAVAVTVAYEESTIETTTEPTTTTTTARLAEKTPQKKPHPRQRQNAKVNDNQAKQDLATRQKNLVNQRESDKALLAEQTQQTVKQKVVAPSNQELKGIATIAKEASNQVKEIPHSKKAGVKGNQLTGTKSAQSNKDKNVNNEITTSKPAFKTNAPNEQNQKQNQSQGKNQTTKNNKQKGPPNKRKRPKLTPKQRQIMRRRMERRKAMMAKRRNRNNGKGVTKAPK